MARTAQQIQADIDAVLADAVHSEGRIRNADGSEAQYRSEEDRQKALSALQREMATVNRAVRRIQIYTNKGF